MKAVESGPNSVQHFALRITDVDVVVVHMIPLAEAAAFTFGCAVLNARRFDPERIGVALMMLIAVLIFALLIVGTATGGIEVAMPGPDEPNSAFE